MFCLFENLIGTNIRRLQCIIKAGKHSRWKIWIKNTQPWKTNRSRKWGGKIAVLGRWRLKGMQSLLVLRAFLESDYEGRDVQYSPHWVKSLALMCCLGVWTNYCLSTVARVALHLQVRSYIALRFNALQILKWIVTVILGSRENAVCGFMSVSLKLKTEANVHLTVILGVMRPTVLSKKLACNWFLYQSSSFLFNAGMRCASSNPLKDCRSFRCTIDKKVAGDFIKEQFEFCHWTLRFAPFNESTSPFWNPAPIHHQDSSMADCP